MSWCRKDSFRLFKHETEPPGICKFSSHIFKSNNLGAYSDS